MNIKRLAVSLALAGFLASSVMACTSTQTSESAGEYVDDSVISNTVRGKLIGDKDLNVFQIDVGTYKGEVQLSGFVNSVESKNRAETVARGVNGVTRVHNDLVVK